MTETIVQFFQSITGNEYLTLFLVSIIPIVELRGAIILMGGMENVHPILGMLTSLAGSSVVIFPLLFLLRPILNKLKKTKVFGKIAAFFIEIFQSKADGVNKKAEESKLTLKASNDSKKFWGLVTFVGVPLPFTGAWTGSGVGAFLDLKIWKAGLAIFIGNLFAASVLTLLTAFIPVKYIDIILYIFLALIVLCVGISFVVAYAKYKKKKAANDSKEVNIIEQNLNSENDKTESSDLAETLQSDSNKIIDDNGEVERDQN